MAKKVRIVKATKNTYWYADKIGEVFEVKDELSFGDYELLDGDHFIVPSDAEVVDESSVKRHYIADESLGGIEREYVEVERKANVGDYVVKDGIIRKVTEKINDTDGVAFDEYTDSDGDEIVGWADGYYKTLSPTDIIRHHGKRCEMVDRKAEVGEEIITLKYAGWTDLVKPGVIMTVTDSEDNGNIKTVRAYFSKDFDDEYRVLVPLSDETSSDPTAPQSPQSTDDIIANLVERLYKAERKIDAQSEMIVHHRRRIIELEDKVDHNTDNIRTWAEDYSEFKSSPVPLTEQSEILRINEELGTLSEGMVQVIDSIFTLNESSGMFKESFQELIQILTKAIIDDGPVFDSTGIKTRNLADLDGKSLRIRKTSDCYDGLLTTTIVGFDDDDNMYVLGTIMEVVDKCPNQSRK